MRGHKQKNKKGSKGYNRKMTEAFLEKNKNKAGIFETASGLQYEIIDQADALAPTLDNIVIVQQRIKLLDGTIVDDTYKQPDPAEFSMKEAIEGYREGLLMMNRGSRYRFYIPPELAWGQRGAGNKIGPNSVLIIDARLIDFY